MVYDENEALKYIRKALPADKQDQYTNNEILEIVSIIYEWYDRQGYLSLDLSTIDEEEQDIDKLTEYVKTQLAANGEILMDPDDVELIVKAEIDYEESIAEFD